MLLGFLLLAGAAPARSAPPESSETMILTRSAVSAGGGAPSVSASHRLTLTVGEEVSASTAASTTFLIRPGLGQVFSYPGPVTDLDARADVSLASMTLTWTAPGYDGGLGSLQAGTSYFVRIASYTVPDTFTFDQAQLLVSTSGVSPGAFASTGATGLVPNTTWYLGLWTMDRTGNVSTGSLRGAGSTLADPPVFVAAPFLEVFSASVTVRWAALPPSPSSGTSEGYVVEASSTDFGALSPGGVIHSSATSDVLVTTLTVCEPALTTDKLYYFRVASLNWQGRRNYIALGSVKTNFEAQPPAPADPAYTDITTGSIVARWDRNGNPLYTRFQLDASPTSGFSEYSSSTTFNLFAATSTLSPNTTYFFRVNATTDTSTSLFADLGSTMTLAYTPESAPSTFSSVGPHVMTLSWLTGGNPVDVSSYSVVLSTDAVYPNANAGTLSLTTSPAGALPAATLAALPNTTYYAFVAALNSIGAPSPYRALGSTVTPAALPLSAVPGFADNAQTAFTAIWDPDGNPLSITTYTVEISTSPTFDPGTQFSVAFDTVPAGPSASFTGLEPNTLYFFRVRAQDFRGIQTAYAELGSTSTLPSPPSLPNFNTVEPTPDAIQLDWSAGTNGPGTGFRANVSTSAVFGAGAAVTTHTVFTTFLSTTGLVVNTTYYLRVAAIGNDGVLSAFVFASTPTRANVPTAAAETFAAVGQSSFTALWNRNGNHISITTYTVHISSASDFNTGVFDEVIFTTAPAGANPAASFSGLNPAVTYYFRVDALSHAGSPSAFAVLGATSTKALAPASPSASADSVSSMTVTWTPVASAGYEVRASSTNFGALSPGGDVAFSSVSGGGASSLGVYGLLANTSYYLRVGAYDWGYDPTAALAGPLATLAAPAANSQVFRVFTTSATVNWNPHPATPQSSSAEGYVLQAATAASVASPSDFTGDIFSSATYGIQPATLTITGLSPGATYTLRVGALNWADAPNFTVAGTTVTPVSNFVWSLAGSGLWNTAANWTPNGVPSAGSRVTIDASVTVTASGNAINFYELTLGDTAGTFSPILLVSTAINSGRNMIVNKNATFTQNVNQALTFSGDISFLQGAVLNHSLIGTTPQSRSVNLDVAGTFTLQAGATAAVSALGFNGGAANGGSGVILGGGGGIGNSASSAGGSGAGHGGGGGAAGINAGGVTYDSLTDPALGGSGGGGGDTAGTGAGGKGGGVVRVHAGTIVFNGIVLATGSIGGLGAAGAAIGGGGGGAGGSVKLSADYFVGAGTITVLGGDGGADVDGLDDPGGGGGGGRVAVSAAVSGSICDLTVTLTGGASGGGTSGAGSDGTYSSTSSFQAPASFAGVFPTSTTMLWTWSLSDYGKNYQVMAATGGAVSPLLGPAAVEYLEPGLLANTTYARFVRVTGCGNGANSASAGRATLASPPTALAQSFTGVQTDNISAAWAAFPPTPQEQSSEGYVLEASSTNFGALSPGGIVTSSQTYSIEASTLAALYPFLDPNTTYYFRVAALNWAGELSSYTALGSTSTLALAPTRLAEDFLKVYAASVTVQWAALAAAPQSQTAEGYIVEASSTNFGVLSPGGVVSSSATTDIAVSTLTVFDPALITNRVYYFRVGALNWNGVVNYTNLGSTLTPLEMQTPLPDDPLFTDLSTGSIVAHWLLSGNPDSTRYRMDVSLDPGFSAYSSSGTFALFEATSTLAANTAYYFRVQASSVLSVSPFALFGSTVTHAFTPAAAGTAFTGVSPHQMTVSWLSGGNPQDSTIYTAIASTGAVYPNANAANVSLTTTPAGALPTATLGVTPNTTYYVFVTAHNSAGAQSRALAAGAVLTPAAAPLTEASTFTSVSAFGFSAIWNADGNPLSVTTYTVESSTSPTFDAGTFDSVVFDTAPASPSATFSTLNGNTTYFFRVRAVDHQSRVTSYADLGSTTTHAGTPAPSVTGIFFSSLTVSWTPVAAASYELRASSTNFGALTPGGDVAFSSATGGSNSSLPAEGLSLNTTYYLRLTAYNWSGHPTVVAPGPHSTLASAVSGAMVYEAFATSVTVNWTPRPASPQSSAVEGYIVEASTAADIFTPSDFTGVIFSSISYGVEPATLTLTGLDAGATYTLRVGALNWSDAPSYAAAGSTITLVSDFVWSFAGSGLWNTATNWTPNGVPSAGSRVTIDANATVTASVTAIRFFTLTLGDPAGTFAPVLLLSTSIANARDMTVHKNATFTSGVVSTLTFTGDVSFLQGSLLNHSANTTSPQTSALNFQVAGTFALQAGATAAVSGLGFNGGAANGGIGVIVGGGGGNGSAASNGGGTGAGHGGLGGGAAGLAAGLTYDSLLAPMLSGSGGGGGDTSGAGGKGGGVVIVNAQTLQLDGLVSADGAAGAAGTGGSATSGAGGGGSGGTVKLSADYFVGAGTITVLGGGGGTDTDNGDDPGGGGGGGRVAVAAALSGSVCDLTITRTGGASGGGTSGAGAIGTFSSTSAFQAPASFLGVSPASATLTWNWSLSANGKNYQVMAATGGAVSPLLGPAAVEYLEPGLQANTTYTRYVRVSGCNAGADSAGAALATLTSPPTALAESFTAIGAGSISAAWAAFPVSPQADSAEGYRVEASTAADFTGTLSFSANADIAASTLAVTGLLPNTTYFFRAAALNWAGAQSTYTALGSTATLALPPVALGEPFLMVGFTSATANWAAFAAPPQASSASAQGYVLEASSTNFGALSPGGAVYSSTTWNVLLSTLTLDVVPAPASLCDAHYFRAGSLNWGGRPNYTVLGSTRVTDDYRIVVSTQDLDIGGVDVNTELVISTSIILSNVGCLVTYQIMVATVTPGSPWVVSTTSGTDAFTVQALFSSVQPAAADFADIDKLTDVAAASTPAKFAADQNGAAVPRTEERLLWFKLGMPRSVSTIDSQQIRVTVYATPP